MSRKHHTKHPWRARSRYRQRLTARGLTKAPLMDPVDLLRRRQPPAAAPMLRVPIPPRPEIDSR